MRYRAVFFDMDGTLMNTSRGIYAAGRYAMESLGFEVSADEKWEGFIGPPLGDCFRITFGVRDDNLIEKLCEAFHDYYIREGCYQSDFYPGIPETLTELKKRGYTLGIVSMKNEDILQNMCSHFGIDKYFDIESGIDLTGTMNKAKLLTKAFSRLGLKPEDCVLVGDTEFDCIGARDAGCDFIKVNWGFGYKKDDPGTISEANDILKLV